MSWRDVAPALQQPQQAPVEATLPTPGKRALTDRMSRREAPEKPAGAGALWLPDELREELRERGRGRLAAGHGNYKAALLAAHLSLLLSKSSNWGFVAELVFGPLSYGAVGAVTGAVGRIRKRAMRAIVEAEFHAAQTGSDAAIALFHTLADRVDPTRVKEGLAHLMRATRSGLKERSGALPPHASSQGALIAMLENAADMHTQDVREILLPQLPDDDLILFVEAHDARDHTREMYSAAIADLLARFERQGIEDIGESYGATTQRGRNAEPGLLQRTEAVRFVYRGRERAAIVDRVLVGGDDTPAVDAASLTSARWVRWVDEDLSVAATSVQAHRLETVLTLDVERGDYPPEWGGMISTWIATVQP